MSSRLRELEAQRGQFWHLPEGAASRAIQQSEPTSTSLPDGDQGAPIRVHLEYDLASAGLSPTQEANLRTVIAAARREVQRLLTLRRPVESRLYIDPPCADIRDGNCYYVGKEKYCYTARHNNVSASAPSFTLACFTT